MIYALGVIYNCYVCMEEILCNDVLLHVSSQLCVQWIHTDSLKSATVSVIYAMQISTSCKIRVVVFFFFPRELSIKPL